MSFREETARSPFTAIKLGHVHYANGIGDGREKRCHATPPPPPLNVPVADVHRNLRHVCVRNVLATLRLTRSRSSWTTRSWCWKCPVWSACPRPTGWRWPGAAGCNSCGCGPRKTVSGAGRRRHATTGTFTSATMSCCWRLLLETTSTRVI